jgi:MTH538 TIR-like domain (DUF1863)
VWVDGTCLSVTLGRTPLTRLTSPKVFAPMVFASGWTEKKSESTWEPLFSAAISEDLVEAGIVVVVCSPYAVKSAWVEKELQLLILTSKGDATPTQIRLVALNDHATSILMCKRALWWCFKVERPRWSACSRGYGSVRGRSRTKR